MHATGGYRVARRLLRMGAMLGNSDRAAGNATTSLWQTQTEPVASDTPMQSDVRTEVCIVGAGISGLSVAYSLVGDGTSVIVVDDGAVGGGETGRTSAHLSCALDDRYYHLESLFGEARAKLAAESHRAAIDSIESTVARLGIECEFRRVDGYLFAPERQQPELDRELAAARRAGLDVTEVDRLPLPFDAGRCLRFAGQAEFQPLAYLRGLAAAIVARGGRIHTGVHVAAIEDGESPRVRLSNGGVIHAKAVVDATNASIISRYDLPVRQAAYRSYVIGFDLPAGAIPRALYWDTEDPYHYLRLASSGGGREILLVGGADHRTGHGNPMTAWDTLEAWTRAHIPMAGAAVTRWSGQIMEPADALGYIGAARGRKNVFLVSGDSGNGLTNGAIAGLLLPALIRGDEHRWAELYAPSRSRHHGIATLMHEAVSSVAPYMDWVSAGDVRSLAEIAPGHGAVLRHGAHRIAAFRDESGGCTLRSARCPHLHGVVRWNPVERTWDCPAHGSRFDACGRVLNSPAGSDLSALDAGVEAAVRGTELAKLRNPWLTGALGGAIAALGAVLFVGATAWFIARRRSARAIP
jgi:glycine/D-amino acid oxidase-like deaminating enzyme/nitrite reductase/ring-hydroxylating ferredoxin subunit